MLPFGFGTEFAYSVRTGKSGKRTRLTLQREVGGVENVGKRQFAVRCHVKVWRFDVENDDDVRDAVVADIVDEMENVTTGTPAPRRMTWRLMKRQASPPSLAQLRPMFRPIQESAFLCNLPDCE